MGSVDYFNEIAQSWNVIRSEYFDERLKYKVLSKVNIKDKVVADLGCGTGFLSLALALDASIVFSIDQSVNMLVETRKLMETKKFDNVYPIKSSIDNLALFDESVDVVFINMALHHVKDAKKAIEEMFRIIKKDGTLIISDVQEHSGEWAKTEMFDEWLGFSNNQMEEWLTSAGFNLVNIENTDLLCKGYSSKGEFTQTGIFIAVANKGGLNSEVYK
ncbi:class I SAM-dependent methyltransferase [Clostridium estertheticum]|uniref:Class I SAM-dependent methyltransferase n=2 Tax=Clostridium TaxID=1485 RepID=A0AA47EMA8_9CLOT|nr:MULTISPECIES: class I SAM-dependent methyltransferase [Clostridium]MBU3100535.1 methyltransferase domain-containing protein [Clostridium sp. DSM 17811]MBU3154569.1 methyltransferase domain-containing protein [Clostridium estertheticum]MBU3185848.1 methyltransferase domain-containing protein [Clostridium estertheticum]MBU3201022.1 methyltransferase domain-containing protein [Clostridium estertheticum]MCB2361420.1 class I SAM-dependent methyltransferase [Clostridium estertheticum]